jgi:hypothetical protein
MIIRGGGLGASMSRYLIERIEATDNIELIFNAEVTGLEGNADASLARVRWRSRLAPDEMLAFDISNLFLFVGADPATGWLDGCGVKVDRAGFVLTGVQDGQNGERPVPALETAAALSSPARNASRRTGNRHHRWKPRCPACSRSATCAPARSSASAARSARVRRWWQRCTAFSPTAPNLRYSKP